MKKLIILLIFAAFVSTTAIGCASTGSNTKTEQKAKDRCDGPDC